MINALKSRPGPKPKNGECVLARTIYMTDSDWQHLRAVSRTYNISISRMIRDWASELISMDQAKKEKMNNDK